MSHFMNRLWRGSLLPLGREAAPLLKRMGLLRSPAGASSLATGFVSSDIQAMTTPSLLRLLSDTPTSVTESPPNFSTVSGPTDVAWAR
jgi:hypothetical protein